MAKIKSFNEEAPKAAPTAKGAGFAAQKAHATREAYAIPTRRGKRRVLHAISAAGHFAVFGQEARALEALVARGTAGVTSLEVASWAYRLGAYIFDLRHNYGLSIETIREEHEGGWHARYVLHSPVSIAEAVA